MGGGPASQLLFSFQYPLNGACWAFCSFSSRLRAVTTASGRFRNCSVIYNGGEVVFDKCRFVNSLFEFGEAAMRTIAVMKFIYQTEGGGGVRFIDEIINQHIKSKNQP